MRTEDHDFSASHEGNVQTIRCEYTREWNRLLLAMRLVLAMRGHRPKQMRCYTMSSVVGARRTHVRDAEGLRCSLRGVQSVTWS